MWKQHTTTGDHVKAQNAKTKVVFLPLFLHAILKCRNDEKMCLFTPF